MSLRQIRGRTTQDLDLLLEEAVALAEFTQLRGFRRRLARLLAGLDPRLAHPLVERADMAAEVLRDLRESDLWITVLRNTDHIVAELLRKRLGHDDNLPDQPPRLATLDATCSYIRPQRHPAAR